MRMKSKSKSLLRQIFILFDSAVFSVLLILPIYRVIARSGRRLLSIVLYCAVFLMVILIRMKKLSKMREKQEQESKNQQKRDRLLLMSDEALSHLTAKKNFILIRKEHPTRFDILEAIRKGADAIGIFDGRDAFRDLIRSYSPALCIYCTDDLIQILEGGEICRTGEGKVRLLKSGFHSINKYILLGIGFIVASFVLKYKIYFRMLSCICLVLACVSGFFGDRAKWNKLLIFLDNRIDR